MYKDGHCLVNSDRIAKNGLLEGQIVSYEELLLAAGQSYHNKKILSASGQIVSQLINKDVPVASLRRCAKVAVLTNQIVLLKADCQQNKSYRMQRLRTSCSNAPLYHNLV